MPIKHEYIMNITNVIKLIIGILEFIKEKGLKFNFVIQNCNFVLIIGKYKNISKHKVYDSGRN